MIINQNIKDEKDEKGRLRKLALSDRDSIPLSCREAAGEKIAATVLSHPAVEKARLIMCYKSFRSEVPTDKIIAELEALGKTLCYPVCGKLGAMQAYSPKDGAWKRGKMGITEPDVEKSRLIDPAEIDLVLCPMVAFDSDRKRMGYGAGYYDRYLPKCKNALVIGIAFEAQRREKIITDEFDRAMDIIITEEKVY